jgi:sec-independent protein translocase protein TatB
MGLFEMLIIAVVALLVVGPERMPETVRGAAMTLGRLKRMFNSTKEEFEKQIGADDIRLELHNEQIMDNLKKMEADFAEIDSDLNKLTQDDEDRLFIEEDNYQDPPEFAVDSVNLKKSQPEEPFAFNEPPAALKPSAVKEPSAVKKPLAIKASVTGNAPPPVTKTQGSENSMSNKEPAANKKPLATTKKVSSKKVSSKQAPAPKLAATTVKKPTDSALSGKQKTTKTGPSEDSAILNENKSPV